MRQDNELTALGLALRTADRSGQGRPYPEALRVRVVEAVIRAAAAGQSEQSVARAIGLPRQTIDRWRRRRDPPAFRPVIVEAAAVPEARGGLVVHGPHGLRIEGLDVAKLAELLGMLS